MSKASRATLLSGLVFPGAGHLYLKSYARASALIIVSLSCITVLVIEATKRAQAILDEIQAQGGAVDINLIVELASQSAQNANGSMTDIATWALVTSWIIGMIDAYRSGKAIDNDINNNSDKNGDQDSGNNIAAPE